MKNLLLQQELCLVHVKCVSSLGVIIQRKSADDNYDGDGHSVRDVECEVSEYSHDVQTNEGRIASVR